MLSLSKTCLSSLWCFRLRQFHTMVIEVMLHGLRRWILFLKIRQIYPLSCVNVYIKEFHFSYRLWDVSAINTAQDDMPNCGNSLMSSSCNPVELSFQVPPRILGFSLHFIPFCTLDRRLRYDVNHFFHSFWTLSRRQMFGACHFCLASKLFGERWWFLSSCPSFHIIVCSLNTRVWTLPLY